MTTSIFKTLLTVFVFTFIFIFASFSSAQTVQGQKGLLWQITGKGIKKPSYVYGTMHVSQKIAFHLGDSFYLALSNCDIVALEQDLDSVIHRWISESDPENPEEALKVFRRNNYEFLNLYNFTLSSYDKELLARKLSAEVREVNYLLKRGEQDDFEEDAWLDLYIYQIAKKLGKGFTGVEGFEESRDLVRKSQKEPKNSKQKKTKRYNYKLAQQVAEAYRKGDIYMLDSIDRMTESEHYREYMLYRRNANMVRRMDSIMQQGKSLFTGVGCSHLPGNKGVLQMLVNMGYKVRPVQSIALEKSRMAKKFENKKIKHNYTTYSSEDGLISATLPTRLTKVNDNSSYTSYLSPDLANGYYYQIEKIACNSVFSGQSPDDILRVIDTMIFENIPGEIRSRKAVVSNGFNGIEVVTELKTGDLNRFQILASPFNVYIVRMSGKKEFAVSSEADGFFKSIRINEGNATAWRKISSPDSVFSIELPNNEKYAKLPLTYEANPSFEHVVYDKTSGHTYMIKQEDILNEYYLEQDSFELNVMARGFAATDDFTIVSRRHFNWQGYNALDAQYKNKTGDMLTARFVICGTRYIMFLMKPKGGQTAGFEDRFFTAIKFNGKPATYNYFEYKDTAMHFSVSTPVMPLKVKKRQNDNPYNTEEEDDADNIYKGSLNTLYFRTGNSNDFIVVDAYKYGYYESQNRSRKDYFEAWKKSGSLKLLKEEKGTRNGVAFTTYTYTDTNTTRQFRVMNILHGQVRYYVEAYIDSVSGNNVFVNTFFNTFNVGDTILKEDVFVKKGHRFFADFTSKDSAARKAAIKNYDEVTFSKRDIKDLCNIIDSISMKGDAGKIRLKLISKLGDIDSAYEAIIPYMQKLYNRFSDTAYLQIAILKAMAGQRNDKAFYAIKPILAMDVPISDNQYDMQSMLSTFGDSLKLARIILPELIELTNISEYKTTAYHLISRMKDSGIINENDYSAIHNRLVMETKIEYKRSMAALTKEKQQSYKGYMPMRDVAAFPAYDYYGYAEAASGSESSLLSDLLDLSLPLRVKNPTMQDIVGRILKVTDAGMRLELMPVLLKYNIAFHDTVFLALAKDKKTRAEFYAILAKAKQTGKFPKAYKHQQDFVLSGIYAGLREFDKIDTVELIGTRKFQAGKDSALIYVYKYKIEDEDEWVLYMSDGMPMDTNRLNHPDDHLIFYAQTEEITPDYPVEKLIDDILFNSIMAYTRNSNGGYYDVYANVRSSGGYSLGY